MPPEKKRIDKITAKYHSSQIKEVITAQKFSVMLLACLLTPFPFFF